MSFYDDDKSRASSDNDEDEEMEDLAGGDADAGQDLEGEGQNEDDNQEALEDDDDQDEPDDSPSRPQPRRLNSSNVQDGARSERRRESLLRHGSYVDDHPKSACSHVASRFYPTMRPEMETAPEYDIVPTIAAPQSTSINTVAATPDMRWVFSGGSDGWIRRFNWVDSANAKLQLTVAQRHPFVDSVQKAGILHSYWENQDKKKSFGTQETDDNLSLSPVYSLAVQHQALWLLSGTASGGINMQTVRHNEGSVMSTLTKHTSAVSVMSLHTDEQSVLSGSWDKTINDWDLNTGQVKRSFKGSGGQISAIEIRPESTLPVPKDIAEPQQRSDTFTSDSNDRRKAKTSFAQAPADGPSRRESTIAGEVSPTDSLFGGGDSLFGDNENNVNGEMGLGLEEENEDYSKAFTESLEQQERQEQADAEATQRGDAEEPSIQPDILASPTTMDKEPPTAIGLDLGSSTKSTQADDMEIDTQNTTDVPDEQPPMSESVFLDSAHDGTVRIWDRRQPNPIARMVPPTGTPPWCMHACWSRDGNAIYAGRRNGTVDEYNLHKGLREPNRTLTFPPGSGAVSTVRAMPNGKHIICASFDILRMYDLKVEENAKKSIVPFQIVPGHRTGVISQLYLDPTCRFMISAGGNRGWEGLSTEVLLGYEVNIPEVPN